MRRVSILSGLFVSLIFSVHPPAAAEAAADIVIGEAQIAGSSASDEFVELRNVTDHAVDITGWKLRKRIRSGAESSIREFSAEPGFRIDIPAGGSLLWANSAGTFRSLTEPGFTSGTSLTDDNSLALFDDDGNLVDAVTYGTGHAGPFAPSASFPANPAKGQSLVRDLGTLSLDISASPTPEHSAHVVAIVPEEDPVAEPDPTPIPADTDIRINELFPNPKEGGEDGEFVELHNRGDTDADLSGFVLRDASRTGKYVLPKDSLIAAGGHLAISRAESGLSLNNADETISLSDPAGNPVDTASYGTTKEEASYSRDGSSFRWSRYLTPGEANRFGEPPSSGGTDIPEKAYRDVPTAFSASGSDDRKYFWDFGDGTTSRKREVSHTYEESGEYSGTLTISEGVEETVKTFLVDVGKFPKRKVSVVAVSANPAGDDAESEWIAVRNKDRKKIDLAGWSIATGSSRKKLSDHPIRESFIIKPGEERVLTRSVASFSLPNGKGHVELRQPDGKTLMKTSYEKEGGVKEDEVWRKQDGGAWAWIREASPEAPGEGIPATDPVGSGATERETPAPAPVTPETPRVITLDDLSPDDLARLEAEVEEKVRRRIFAELLDDGNRSGTEATVLGASDERGGYSGTMFRRMNQALSGLLSGR